MGQNNEADIIKKGQAKKNDNFYAIAASCQKYIIILYF